MLSLSSKAHQAINPSNLPFRPFVPHPLVRGGHLQSIIGIWGDEAPSPHVESRVVAVEAHQPDHPGQVVVDIDAPLGSDQEAAPILFLIHGLGGCSESRYMLRIARKMTPLGFRVIRFNHRNCKPSHVGRSPGIFHAGRTHDILAGVLDVAQRWPKAPLALIGFSLSGSMLLKLLGEQRGLGQRVSQLRGCMAVCPPLDLENCSVTLAKMRNLHFDQYYARRIGRRAVELSELREEINHPNLPKFFSLRDFDARFTAYHAGYQDRRHYYDSCSPHSVLNQIADPTLVLIAKDDPIVPPQHYRTWPLSPSTRVHIARSGGHMGFISRHKTRFGDYRWLEEAIADWSTWTMANQEVAAS